MIERNGRYTVRTSYKLAMMELLHTDRFHVEGEWHRIWKVNSPHKARNLLWRICRECRRVSSYNHGMYNVRLSSPGVI